MRIAGQRVLLTGASGGLGAALAWQLARRGATCVLAARRRDQVAALSARIAAELPDVAAPLAVVCDVCDRKSVADAVDAAARRLGGLDILVNNAGTSAYGETARTSPRDLSQVLAVNFLGSVTMMQEVLPHLRRQHRGVIVNIASVAALHGVPYLAAYGASKAALAAFSQSLRAEVASEGIRIQMIYPDYTQTPLFDHERRLGGARRPRPPYAPADRTARRIVRAIQQERAEVVLSTRGRWLAFLHGAGSPLVDHVMRRLAAQLGEREVSRHE
jgi:short-subunit dehydrogenase